MGARAHSDGGRPPSGPAELLEHAWAQRDTAPTRAASLVDRARRGGLDRVLVTATMTVESYLDFHRGRLRAPLDLAVEADASTATAVDGPWRHRLSCLLADLHAEAGLFGAAFDDLFRAIAHAEQIHDSSGAAAGHRRLGRLLIRLGDFRGASACFDQAGRLLDRSSPEEASWLLVDRAELLAASGELAEAFDLLSHDREHADGTDDREGTAGHDRVHADGTGDGDCDLDSGDDREGEHDPVDHVDQDGACTELTDPAGRVGGEHHGGLDSCVPLAASQAAASMRALLAAKLGHRDHAKRELATADALRRELGRPDQRLLVTAATIALLDGDHGAARRLADKAADAYRAAERAVPAEVTQLRADLAIAADDHRAAIELVRNADREEVARRRRYPDSRPEGRRLVHTTELRRQLESLRRSNDRLASANEHLRHLSDRAVELSARDPLTGLVNRGQLFREADVLLRLARRHRRPLSAAMVDVDRFKSVNDQHFHTTGDEVLQRVARLLVDGVRDSDLVGRYGGDEFVLLLPEVPAAGAVALCERVRRSVAAHDWDELASGLEVTVTIGIAEAAQDESAEELLHRADQRLYLAKSLGRNQVASGETGG